MSNNPRSRFIIYLLISCSGLASLSWEVIWQIKSSLALGISAWGAAITLAVVMGGMSAGAYLLGNTLRDGSATLAIRIYGLLEIMTGLAGIFLNVAFQALENIDTWAYRGAPGSISFVYLFGIFAVLGFPSMCMGATIPVFGRIARQFQISIATLYGLNTLGAACGVLFTALFLIPFAGITQSLWLIAGINLFVGIATFFVIPASTESAIKSASVNLKTTVDSQVSIKEIYVVFVTGFVTFVLEIAWFRAFATVFPNTTDVFAIILACMLIALGLAARNVTHLKEQKKLLGTQLWLAGILILIITPIIERLDILLPLAPYAAKNPHVVTANVKFLLTTDNFNLNAIAIRIYWVKVLIIFFVMSILIIPPVRYLGVALPWILDDQHTPRAIGRFYAINTLAAMIGSIGAAWLLLPMIGFAKTSVLAGVLVISAAIMLTPGSKRYLWSALAVAAISYAFYFDAGIGRVRVQGFFANLNGKPATVLESIEGPASTISVVEDEDGARMLLINSALAAIESGKTINPSSHYMSWMGYLPMLYQSNPKNALVICFGSGQTANAVRKENPESLDIVDVEPQIFKLAHFFNANEDVLNDKRVTTTVMDGRAYLRRTLKSYDVITLEPMPPTLAGVNALYSREFYELARNRLSSNGVIAQWLPFHAVAPHYAASIAKTFISVFPNAMLWIDPVSKNGILIGSKDNDYKPVSWPGFARSINTLDLTPAEVYQNIALNPQELSRYGDYGELITDDNQLLAYGKVLYAYLGLVQENFELLHQVNPKIELLH